MLELDIFGSRTWRVERYLLRNRSLNDNGGHRSVIRPSDNRRAWFETCTTRVLGSCASVGNRERSRATELVPRPNQKSSCGIQAQPLQVLASHARERLEAGPIPLHYGQGNIGRRRLFANHRIGTLITN